MEVCVQCRLVSVGSGHFLCPQCAMTSRVELTPAPAGGRSSFAIVPKMALPESFTNDDTDQSADSLGDDGYSDEP